MTPEQRQTALSRLDARDQTISNYETRCKLLTAALRQCKAAAESKDLPPSARLELVRDIATPALIQWRELTPCAPMQPALDPVEVEAGDESGAARDAAIRNYARLAPGWCSCLEPNPVQAYWHNPKTPAHGWMCFTCRRVTQIG